MAGREASLQREMKRVGSSFRDLAAAFSRLGPALAANGAEKAAAGMVTARKKPRLTAAYRATLKLQGQYMGTLRGLKPAQRAAVMKLRAEKGVRAAIAAARRMGG